VTRWFSGQLQTDRVDGDGDGDGQLFDASKHFIEKLRQSYPDHHRSETMPLLARIYARDGKQAEALSLLRDCISRIEADKQCSPQEVAELSAPLISTLRDLER
jgi:tRNA C32,U32 (ribose-2'-O)-methylase TrmJ